MKIGKQSLIYLTVGVLIALALFLNSTGMIAKVGGSLLNFTRQERNELNQKLTSTQSKIKAIQLEPLSTRKVELEQQLVSTATQLDQLQAAISQKINKTDTIAVLFTTAKAYSLDITSMTISGLTDAELEEVPVKAVSLVMSVEGDMANLVPFITKLNTLYTYGAVQSADIVNSENISVKKPYANVKLALYTVQGG